MKIKCKYYDVNPDYCNDDEYFRIGLEDGWIVPDSLCDIFIKWIKSKIS